MHRRIAYGYFGRMILTIGVLGLSAVGCSEKPGGTSKTSMQEVPYQIPVPRETAAVAAITGKGNVRIFAVTENGKRAEPAVCDIKGPNECPFEFPEVVTTIEIGRVGYDAVAETDARSGVAYAASTDKKCIFVLRVGNKVYYYLAPCSP